MPLFEGGFRENLGLGGMANSAHFGSEEKDAIHLLPLLSLPLKTRGLKKARLVKNSCLEGVVELFSSDGAGSGQMKPEALTESFDFSGERSSDLEIIRSLADLPSYDVYSLRLGFRDLGIAPDDNDALKLSPAKSAELMAHMNSFTRPLIAKVYGNEEACGHSLKEIVQLFIDPDMKQARRNLENIAKSLGIHVTDIPLFLERYADVYLSLAYYAAAIEYVIPQLENLNQTMERIRSDARYRKNGALINRLIRIEARLADAQTSISNVIEVFKQRTHKMWENIDGPTFRGMERLIIDYQRDIGANLCALVVKMDAWDKLRGKASAETCLQFIMSEIAAGIERMPALDVKRAEAPIAQAPVADDDEMVWVA